MKLVGVEKLIFFVMLVMLSEVEFSRFCVICSCLKCRYLNIVWLRLL